jgi:hypothetical protein
LNFNLVTIGQELFGRGLRLLLAHWIVTLEDPVFFERQAALGVMALGSAFQQGEVAKELARLERLGMLETESPSSGTPGGRKYFRRTESPLWDAIRVIGDVIGSETP